MSTDHRNHMSGDALHKAREWMREHTVVDGIAAGPTSERTVKELVAGGVNAVQWTVGGHSEVASWVHWPFAGIGRTTESAFMNMVGQRHLAKRLTGECCLAQRVADIESAREQRKVAIIHGWQGAEPVEGNLQLLEIFHELGLRVLQICYNDENRFGYGCMETIDNGLKSFGRVLLELCNDLGVVVDCSHSGERTALELIERSEDPCVFSHSNPKGVRDHPRNISDSVIKRCAARGGVVGCNVWADFVVDTSAGRQPTPLDWVRCVDYVVDLVGVDHVGIGTDVCGFPTGELWWANSGKVDSRLPFDLHEVEGMSHGHANFVLLVAALVERGYREHDVAKIIGANWLRVFRQVWGA